MARLTKAKRAKIPTSKFAGPGRSFPIEDRNHARAALALKRFAPNPSAIVAKVHRAYPDMVLGGRKGK